MLMLGFPPLLPLFQLGAALLQDPDVRVRLAATDAMGHLAEGARPYAKALEGRSLDEDTRVRCQALRALEKLGERRRRRSLAPPAIVSLQMMAAKCVEQAMISQATTKP